MHDLVLNGNKIAGVVTPVSTVVSLWSGDPWPEVKDRLTEVVVEVRWWIVHMDYTHGEKKKTQHTTLWLHWTSSGSTVLINELNNIASCWEPMRSSDSILTPNRPWTQSKQIIISLSKFINTQTTKCTRGNLISGREWLATRGNNSIWRSYWR